MLIPLKYELALKASICLAGRLPEQSSNDTTLTISHSCGLLFESYYMTFHRTKDVMTKLIWHI